MSKRQAFIVLAYWVAAGSVPIVMFRALRTFELGMGCPSSGDCYFPGSEHLLGLEIAILYSAAVLIPVAAWNIFRAIRVLAGRVRDS